MNSHQDLRKRVYSDWSVWERDTAKKNIVVSLDISGIFWAGHQGRIFVQESFTRYTRLASCPWGPATAHGVGVLSEMYARYMQYKPLTFDLDLLNGSVQSSISIRIPKIITVGPLAASGTLLTESVIRLILLWMHSFPKGHFMGCEAIRLAAMLKQYHYHYSGIVNGNR